MAILPLPENTRVEITIQPWAISASDGSKFTSPIHGVWFTQFNPLYSHPLALETEAGLLVSNIPHCILRVAIFEASRWVDAIANPACSNVNTAYYQQVRWRYVTLRALLTIISETHGVNAVSRKLLGDFEIEFDTSAGDNNLISRILDELSRLEPIIQSGGCLGIGTSFGAVGAVKGADDPYRPILTRDWYAPRQGEPGQNRGIYSPRYNRDNQYPDRYRHAPYSLTRLPRNR